jgi:transposase
MSDVVEGGAVSGGERRRRSWSMDEKRRMIAESEEPGASVAQVALRHGVNANLLFTWRRQLAAGGLAATSRPVELVPVTVTKEPAPAPALGASELMIGRMEILLSAGERITVGADVDAAALARVIKALWRR